VPALTLQPLVGNRAVARLLDPQRRLTGIADLPAAAGGSMPGAVRLPLLRESATRSLPIQRKWISDGSGGMVWDRQLDGLRWHYDTTSDTMFFVIEGQTPIKQAELVQRLGALEGRQHARSYDEWRIEGFAEGNWRPTDRDVVPFRAHRNEFVKLANDATEIRRTEVDQDARSFLETGEAGKPELFLPDLNMLLGKLIEDVTTALAGKSKAKTALVKQVAPSWLAFRQIQHDKSGGTEKERAKFVKTKWNEVLADVERLPAAISQTLNMIGQRFGDTAYVESLNATTNLLKRFMDASSGASNTSALNKMFQVYNQLHGRLTQLGLRQTAPIESTAVVGRAKPAELTFIRLGTQMSAVEGLFDVLARRTGANKDPSIKHVHEVDLAFVQVFRGVTEAYANPRPEAKELAFQGGGGVGEKVFAVGHRGAVDFRNDVEKTEERFYALIMPKGFIETFGMDLRTRGSGGASAREPNEAEFARHTMPPMNGDPEIAIPADKLFFIRAETSTPLGQVDIHFGWRDMLVRGEKINHADLFRRYVLAVVEFTKSGDIIKIDI
jgi:hypothetical protein